MHIDDSIHDHVSWLWRIWEKNESFYKYNEKMIVQHIVQN